MVALLENPLRLVRREKATKPSDRRLFPRREARGAVAACRLDHSIPARREPLVIMELRDLSIGGLSALSDVAMHCGERIIVRMPPQGPQAPWGAYGRVLRCEPSGTGYRVAVEFDPMPAAA
jgi:hypothetical protein